MTYPRLLEGLQYFLVILVLFKLLNIRLHRQRRHLSVQGTRFQLCAENMHPHRIGFEYLPQPRDIIGIRFLCNDFGENGTALRVPVQCGCDIIPLIQQHGILCLCQGNGDHFGALVVGATARWPQLLLLIPRNRQLSLCESGIDGGIRIGNRAQSTWTVVDAAVLCGIPV